MSWADYTGNLSSVFNGMINWLTSISNALLSNKIFITIVFIAVLYLLFEFLFDIIEKFKNGGKNEEKNI